MPLFFVEILGSSLGSDLWPYSLQSGAISLGCVEALPTSGGTGSLVA